MSAITLLLIDDDAVDRKAVRRALKVLGNGYELQEVRDGRTGIGLIVAQPFDCILIDYSLPDMTGLDLIAELRERIETCIPIVMLTGSGNEVIAVEAMKRGAHDYLTKSRLGPETLALAVANAIEKCSLQKRLAVAQRDLERLALYDNLTGLGNRNLFHIELARAFAISRRKNVPFPLLMMDLDKFKTANDTFGHEAGDAILASVGVHLRNISRASDSYFRLGGDEFAGILDAGSDGTAAARNIMTAVANPVPFGDHLLMVEISIGVAVFPTDGGDAEALMRVADAAMYAAKKATLADSLADNALTGLPGHP